MMLGKVALNYVNSWWNFDERKPRHLHLAHYTLFRRLNAVEDLAITNLLTPFIFTSLHHPHSTNEPKLLTLCFIKGDPKNMSFAA